jgi:hypothetical protein
VLTQDPEGSGSDAESSNQGEDSHKKRRYRKRAVKNNGKPSKGRISPSRSGVRANKHPDDEDPSATGPDTESVDSFSSVKISRPLADVNILGPPVAGLVEIVPSRSDYKKIVSHRAYLLNNLSQDFGPKITGKLTGFSMLLQHSMDETFSGETPVGIHPFLRSFKEAADHNRISEGATARLIPYFLTGIAKEGYRT